MASSEIFEFCKIIVPIQILIENSIMSLERRALIHGDVGGQNKIGRPTLFVCSP